MIEKNIERWEDIPKVKISNMDKKPIVTSKLKEHSDLINSDWDIKNNKSFRTLEKIYLTNLHKVNNNIIRTPHKDLYNIISDKEILRLAYKKLSKNKGAMTPGSGNITYCNINESFLDKLSEELKKEEFTWNPFRRIYVEKPGNKKKKETFWYQRL
jgi:hypothetical protein